MQLRGHVIGNANELRNIHIETLTADPASLTSADIGRIWFRSDTNQLKMCIAAATAITIRANNFTIVNGDIDAAAGIVRSKLDFGAGLVNADISAAAAIALSKLATDPLARANHTGTQLAATISNFDTQVRTSRLDQFVAPTADISLNSHKITNLLDGTNATDAITLSQLDAASRNKDYKESVRLASVPSQGSYTIASGSASALTGLTAGTTLGQIDGVEAVVGDRVLIKNAPAATGAASASDSTQPANGLYTVTGGTTTSVNLTRAVDADTSSEVTAGMTTWCEAGTLNAATEWTLDTSGAITLATTAIHFSKTGQAAALSATLPLTLTGLVLALTYAAPLGLDGSNRLTITDPELSALAGLVSAADSLPYFTGSGTAGLATLTTFGRSLIDDTSAANARTTLGNPIMQYAAFLGDGSATSFTVTGATHGMSSMDMTVKVYEVVGSVINEIQVDVSINTGTFSVTIGPFSVAPATNSIRIVIQGIK